MEFERHAGYKQKNSVGDYFLGMMDWSCENYSGGPHLAHGFSSGHERPELSAVGCGVWPTIVDCRFFFPPKIPREGG